MKPRTHIARLVGSTDSAYQRGDYGSAIAAYRLAIAMAQGSQLVERVEFASVLNNFGVVCKYAGAFEDAAEMYRAALAILEETFGPDHLEVATLFHNLGGLEHARGCYVAGEPFARRSVEIRERALGPDHVDVAADIEALASLLDGQGRFDESIPLHDRALGIFEQAFGPEHLEIGMVTANLAAVKHRQGRWEEAESFYRRSLEIKRRHLGDSHPSVGVTWNNMSVLAESRGDDAEAEVCLDRALFDSRTGTECGASESHFVPDQACPLDKPEALVMNRAEYCAFPPGIAADVEMSIQTHNGQAGCVAGSAHVGRYLKMGAAERQLLELLDGEHTVSQLLAELARRNGAAPAAAVLSRFLGALDDAGILAGVRVHAANPSVGPENQFYWRRRLFNPEPLFDAVLPWVRWIWTRRSFAASACLMLGAAVLALMNRWQLSLHAMETLRADYQWVFLAAWLVTISHEFAHGMTAKAFGGRATEVGALLIYYCVPALYCDVSGMHLIPERRRRMWVIAAGIYWQVLVGSLSLLAWFAFSPETMPARVAMVFVLGSLLEMVFNVNPLIKLDGYYFLSQWLRISNLMARSRACWAAILKGEAPACRGKERRVLLVYGALSFGYRACLIGYILWFGWQYLIERLGLAGLVIGVGLASAGLWRWVKARLQRKEGAMPENESKPKIWRRSVPLAAAVGCLLVCCLPWQGSVGCYGILTAIPGREAAIRAAESGSLIAVTAQPGQTLRRGQSIGRMANVEIEEQLAQVRTEVARVKAESERLAGEIEVQRQALTTAEGQLQQRRNEFADLDGEQRQIRTGTYTAGGTTLVRTANLFTSPQPLPAALAALEADAQQLKAKLIEAEQQLGRTRGLFQEKLSSRSQLEAAESKASALRFDLHAAEDRLSAALVEHERHHARARSEMNLAASSLNVGRSQIAALAAQMDAANRLRLTLEERGRLLEQRRAAFELTTPVTGTVFGEDLPQAMGRYFVKGAEICRVADTTEMRVRVQAPEEAMADVSLGEAVRLKTRAYPDRTFYGVVSRIGGDAEADPTGRRSYRVELTIRNEGGLLRPGMTVFTRIDFGRHAVAWLAAHKLRQALRPELWML